MNESFQSADPNRNSGWKQEIPSKPSHASGYLFQVLPVSSVHLNCLISCHHHYSRELCQTQLKQLADLHVLHELVEREVEDENRRAGRRERNSIIFVIPRHFSQQAPSRVVLKSLPSSFWIRCMRAFRKKVYLAPMTLSYLPRYVADQVVQESKMAL